MNSSFKKNGKLNYGEIYIPGFSKKRNFYQLIYVILLCANNELSGPLVAIALAKFSKKKITILFRSYLSLKLLVLFLILEKI